jgi:hypothetical protein
MQLATEDREDHEGHHHADGAGGERIDLAARSLPRRRFFSDMPDRGLFAAVVVLGFPLIIGLKLYEFDARLVAAFAVALMIAYGVIAYKIPAVHVRLDRLCDNFYYIGFIFTLASMSAALLQLTRGADIEALLGSFGIALFTTITHRHTPAAVEAETVPHARLFLDRAAALDYESERSFSFPATQSGEGGLQNAPCQRTASP